MEKSTSEFKNRDIVTANDVSERFGVCYTTATELIKTWKLQLKRVGRDRLDLSAKLTKDDYAYILGIDISLLYK